MVRNLVLQGSVHVFVHINFLISKRLQESPRVQQIAYIMHVVPLCTQPTLSSLFQKIDTYYLQCIYAHTFPTIHAKVSGRPSSSLSLCLSPSLPPPPEGCPALAYYLGDVNTFIISLFARTICTPSLQQ